MKLNFGCGRRPFKDFVNVDIQKAPWIDKSFDFEKTPYPLPDNTFDYVIADQVMEHLGNLHGVFDELYRICKNKAIIEIRTPYVGSKSAYYDLGHKSFFNDRSFYSICGTDFYNIRNNNRERFRIKELELVPQRYLKWLDPKILKLLAVFLNNIHVQINVKIEVIK